MQRYQLGRTFTQKGLLNVDFSFDKNSINNTVAVEGPAMFGLDVKVTAVIRKMKHGKAVRQPSVIVEMIETGGRHTLLQ